MDEPLARTAVAHGIELSYTDNGGVRHNADPDIVTAVLAAMGVEPGETVAPAPSPVIVAWDGTAPPQRAAATDAWIELELADGTTRRWRAPTGQERVTLPGDLPPGRHVLRIGESTIIVLSAPRHCHTGPIEGRAWGGFLPLHALRTARDSGVGDVADLRGLSGWLASLGAAVVSTLPLLAAFLDDPCEPSPYAPVSRRMWNELYLDADALLGRRAPLPPADPAVVDIRAVARAKRAALAPLVSGPRPTALVDWLNDRPHVVDYARFRAAGERNGVDWRSWPQSWTTNIPDDAVDAAAVRWHEWSQWTMSLQLASLSRDIAQRGQALYLDLPLGSHRDGFDHWRHRDLFLDGVSLGAPPDAFFAGGQDWGLAPLHPERSRCDGHQFFSDIVEHQLTVAGLLRIDHVMGLHRQFWVPAGAAATEGVYVRYPHDELWAVLSLLSHSYGAGIVGEDLGTVPAEVRHALEEHDVRGLFVAQWELAERGNGLRRLPPPRTVASLNTHDLAPFAAFWREREPAVAGDAIKMGAARHAILGALARSDADVVLVNLEDLWLEEEPQNRPGTVGGTNWCRRARRTLEQLETDEGLVAELRDLDGKRRRPASPSPSAGEPILATDLDLYLFNEGNHSDLPERFGAHEIDRAGLAGAAFSVWAPNARTVAVIGDASGWDHGTMLGRRASSGVWEGFVPGARAGQHYKLRVTSADGRMTNRADPLARATEGGPGHASVLDVSEYRWGDGDWMAGRAERHAPSAPLSIYEAHLGSWRRVPGEGDRWLSYREIAPMLADHLIAHGFTHVELLPVMEHPFYGSWGYQVTGFFSPTARYGAPDDLRYLVDHLHQRDIGVILDWVPAHFPADNFALARFDGSHLYEHADPREGRHPDWGSLIFNYGRHEVRAFLISSACWWVRSFHADGLRVDAVASMLYRDYSRGPGEWVPNVEGGRENLEALSFIRHCNDELRRRFPDTLVIAEESTAWPGVTAPTEWGGLGFHLKWDLGWMHDTLTYFRRESVHRQWHHGELTFRAVYAASERFVLALSHDEVVHGKGSLLAKMTGDEWQRRANLRLLYGYQHALPGKKLLFMGGEFGQWREWNHDASLDWHLLHEEAHAGIARWVTHLNGLHRTRPALHERDGDGSNGFSWIDGDDAAQSVLVFARHAFDANNDVVVLANFTPVPRSPYRVGLPHSGRWELIANSDDPNFGGSGFPVPDTLDAEEQAWHKQRWSAPAALPPLALVAYARVG
ncbi:MAG: 1,4-alpha-glucan branching protein GlgB [Acidimicrobiales bacterium]